MQAATAVLPEVPETVSGRVYSAMHVQVVDAAARRVEVGGTREREYIPLRLRRDSGLFLCS